MSHFSFTTATRLRSPLPWLAIAVVFGATSAGPAPHTKAAAEPHAAVGGHTLIAAPDPALLQTAEQARDSQALVDVTLSSPDNPTQERQWAESGRVTPLRGIDSYTAQSIQNSSNNMAAVAYVEIDKGGNDRFPMGRNWLSLGYDGKIWFASISPDGQPSDKRLHVRRTTYIGLTSKAAFPATARWDWDETTGNMVIGVPCDRAWCLIGTATKYRDDEINGDVSKPLTQRVRGWHDRKPVVYIRAWAYVYPAIGLDELSRVDFQQTPTIAATTTTGAASHTLKLYDPQNATQWKGTWDTSAPQSFDRLEQLFPVHPAAARWAHVRSSGSVVEGVCVYCASGICTGPL